MMELFPTSYNVIKQDRKYKSTVAERLQLIIDNLGREFQKFYPELSIIQHLNFRRRILIRPAIL